jgi:hypothetical protein
LHLFTQYRRLSTSAFFSNPDDPAAFSLFSFADPEACNKSPGRGEVLPRSLVFH